MAVADDFQPTMTTMYREDSRLEYLDKYELVELLPKSMQNEIRRAEWAWENIDKLAGEEVYDPFDNSYVRDRRFTREEILYMFDPEYVEVPSMDEEANLLAYAAMDKVLWARTHLYINPRSYQILFLRDPSRRKLLRWGRRCGKSLSMAIDMIYKCQVNEGYICMLIAPMKAHAEVVWKMIKQLLARNPDFNQQLMSRAIKQKEAPYYEMTFPNGSIIKMFTSGVKNSNKGDSFRGQEADTLYLDEVDMMNPDDRPAFTAIMRSTGRPWLKEMIVASTPNGRRDMMYEYSTKFRDPKLVDDDLTYSEYHFPTHADVNYTRSDDREQQAMLTREGYQHEILAIYGEETSGVFLKQHLDRAQDHYPDGYEYMDIAQGIYNRAGINEKLIVGVDWDKFGAGVNIVMCKASYNPMERDNPNAGRLSVVARWEVPRSSDTLTRATDFVKTVYSVYKPDAIYIDRGYGDMQHEQLLLAAKSASLEGGDPRCVGLEKVLRGVHFAESVTVFDPFSNEEVKKDVKDYMVTLSIKMFEDDQIVLNSRDYDEVPGPTDMIKQFEGYQIMRRSVTGKPIYEAANSTVGDHALDAFMLCVMAMHQEWGSFSRPEQHAKPMSMPFNIFEIAAQQTIDLSQIGDEQPEGTFRIRRSNIKAGKMTYSGGRRLKRKSF
jgi:hypothetical protein